MSTIPSDIKAKMKGLGLVPDDDDTVKVARVVDDELSNLGWSPAARQSFLGDMGRENNWNRNIIFKGHSDPKNKAQNLGIISWQGDRRTNLINHLNARGLAGRDDDDALREMARFVDKEMADSPEWKSIHQAMRNPNLTTAEASRLLHSYIKYVPTAPYNTPDSEYMTKNNRIWAEKARKLGLAQGNGNGQSDSSIKAKIDAVLGAPSTGQEENAEAQQKISQLFGDGDQPEAAPQTGRHPALDKPGFSEALSLMTKRHGPAKDATALRARLEYLNEASERVNLADPKIREEVVSGQYSSGPNDTKAYHRFIKQNALVESFNKLTPEQGYQVYEQYRAGNPQVVKEVDSHRKAVVQAKREYRQKVAEYREQVKRAAQQRETAPASGMPLTRQIFSKLGFRPPQERLIKPPSFDSLRPADEIARAPRPTSIADMRREEGRQLREMRAGRAESPADARRLDDKLLGAMMTNRQQSPSDVRRADDEETQAQRVAWNRLQAEVETDMARHMNLPRETFVQNANPTVRAAIQAETERLFQRELKHGRVGVAALKQEEESRKKEEERQARVAGLSFWYKTAETAKHLTKTVLDAPGQMLEAAGLISSAPSAAVDATTEFIAGRRYLKELSEYLGGSDPSNPENTPFYQLGASLLKNNEDLFQIDKDYAQELAPQIANGVGQLVTQLATGAGVAKALQATPQAAKWVAGILYTSQSAQSGYVQAREYGATPDEARLAGVIHGIVTLATERVPMDEFIDNIMKAPSVSRGMKNYMRDLAKASASGFLKEGGQEGSEGLLTGIVDTAIYDQPLPTLPGVAQQAGVGGLVGSLAGGGTHTAGRLLNARNGNGEDPLDEQATPSLGKAFYEHEGEIYLEPAKPTLLGRRPFRSGHAVEFDAGKFVGQRATPYPLTEAEADRVVEQGFDPLEFLSLTKEDGQVVITHHWDIRFPESTAKGETPYVTDQQTDETAEATPFAPVISQGEGGMVQQPILAAEPQTVSHPNPQIDGQPIISQTQDGRVVVPNPQNKTGVSIVKAREQADPKAVAQSLADAPIAEGSQEVTNAINQTPNQEAAQPSAPIGTPPVPESQETIRSQFQAAINPESNRFGVLITKGTKRPPTPKGFIGMPVGDEWFYLYRPKAEKLGVQSVEDIRAFAADRANIERAIGIVSPVADTSQGVAVRTEDAEGRELETRIVDSPEALAEQSISDAVSHPEAVRQKVLPAEEATAKRIVEQVIPRTAQGLRVTRAQGDSITSEPEIAETPSAPAPDDIFGEMTPEEKKKSDALTTEMRERVRRMQEVQDSVLRRQEKQTKGRTAEELLQLPETRARIDNIGLDVSEIERGLAKTKNYQDKVFYHASGGLGESGLGRGLYVGKDKEALHGFYNLGGGKIEEYHGEPRFLDLTDYDELAAFEREAEEKFGDNDQLRKLTLERGYDGIRYYDPEATGEEFVVYNTKSLTKKRVDKKQAGKERESTNAPLQGKLQESEPEKQTAPKVKDDKQSVSAIFDEEFDALFNLREVAEELNELFGGAPLKMAHGEAEDTYEAVKPLLEQGIRASGGDMSDVRASIRTLLTALRDKFNMSPEVIQRMKPYIVRFIEEKDVDSASQQEENKSHVDASDSDSNGQAGDAGERPADVRGTAKVGKSRQSSASKSRERDGGLQSDEGRRERKDGDLETGLSEESSGADDSQPQRGGNRDSAGDRVPRGNDFIAPVGSLTRTGSWRDTARTNLDILELVKRLEAEERLATPEEQALLVKFTGWGAGEIANNLFPGYGDEIDPRYAREGWKELAERAKNLFTPEELKTAKRSTQYAHYTSEKVIRSIWAGLTQLGFRQGKILEPGMGVGLFAVAAPSDTITRSRYTGVEMDSLTARVAKQVLQNHAVLEADYVKQKLPDNFFDVAIGNPPFANIVITDDPKYKKHRFLLHDYFFAKTIDKVRPGGLLVFVTSKGTMDKADKKAREYIAERADLLGAIRLPQTAFKQNAGTEVVTDVLFLRKRIEGEEPSGEAWVGHGEVTAKDRTGEDHTGLINEYYLAHPEMVLGEHSWAGTMRAGYGKTAEYTVTPKEGDIEEHFLEAVRSLPTGVFAEQAKTEEKKAQVRERDWNPASKKEGSLYVHADGTLMRVEHGSGVQLSQVERLPATQEKWLKDYVGLRTALKQTQYDQLNEGNWEKSLAALNQTYDAFVKKHGRVLDFTVYEKRDVDEDGNEIVERRRRFKNSRVLNMDIESPLVEAMERITEDDEIVKGSVLLRRTIKRPEPPVINTLSDALAVSLDQTGTLNLDHVAKLITDAGTSMTRDEVIRDLGESIFEVPGGDWQMRDEYLSGFVVQKLEEAEAAAKTDRRFERNVKALAEVQPKPLLPAEIQVGLGAAWVPVDYVTKFGREVIGIRGDVEFNPILNEWKVEGASGKGSQSNRSASADWGTARRSPQELFEAALAGSPMRIYDTYRENGREKKELNESETAAANDKIKKMRQEFKSWVWQDADRAAELSSKYNRQFNNIVPRSFDGAHMTLPGLSHIYQLHPHQKRAVWRILQSGNTYLAHAVGAGKTLEMIVSAMEQKRLGLISKPLFIVPGHMLKQFSSEFLEAYPMANILVADEESFKKENRRRFVAQAALNDLDAVVMTHTSFGKIQSKPESAKPIVDNLVQQLRSAISELDEDDQREKRLIKRLENRIEQIERRFEGRTSGEGKDDVINFEDMGVDFLYVDEAHQFRKLDFVTNHSEVKGITPEGSQRALDLHIKLSWLNHQRPGRSAVLASGTPITNTLGELYTIQRLLDPQELEDSGIDHFDAWAAQFGEVVPDYEMNAAGRYELVERFSKFINVPELMKRVRKFMDVLTLNQLSGLIDLPTIEGGKPEIIVVQPTESQKNYLEELNQRIETSRNWKPSFDQPNNPDPLIAIIADARLAAVDMRYIRGENDPDSKLNKMISEIIKSYHEFKDLEYTNKLTGEVEAIKGAAQIVFAVQGFGEGVIKNRGFDAKRYFIRRMVEGGIPAQEIAFISDYKTADSKENLFKEMRQGTKKILVGSPGNMGTGVNVQKRLKRLHFLSPPWYPADVEQPDGRIIRQGNQNKSVILSRYATKGTYDSTGWSMNARKARAIEQAMSGDDSVRSIEDISESSLYEQASAMAAGDERAIKLAGLRRDIEVLERLETAHRNEQNDLRYQRAKREGDIREAETSIAKMKEAVDAVGSTFIRGEDFRLTANGETPEKRNEMGAALVTALRKAVADNRLKAIKTEQKITVEIGRAMGKHPIVARLSGYKDKKGAYLELTIHVGVAESSTRVTDGYVEEGKISEIDPQGLATRIYNALNGFDSKRRDYERDKTTAERELKQIESKIGRPFESEQELFEKVAEFAQLQAEMAGEGLGSAADIAEGWDVESVVSGMDVLKMASSDAQRLRFIENAADLVLPMQFEREGDLITGDNQTAEILRRADEQVRLEASSHKKLPESSDIDGLFLEPQHIDAKHAKSYLRVLNGFIGELKKNGYHDEARQVKKFTDELLEAAKAGKGTAIFRISDKQIARAATAHESLHQGSYLGSGGKPLSERLRAEDKPSIMATPLYKKGSRALRAAVAELQNAPDDIIIEELAARSAQKSDPVLDSAGITDAERDDYLEQWTHSFVLQNGENAFDEFRRTEPHVRKAIQNAKRFARFTKEGRDGQTAASESGQAGRGNQRPPTQGASQKDSRDAPEIKTRLRALPSTLRAQGLLAADEIYEVYSNKAALLDGKAQLESLGWEAAEALLRSDKAKGAEDIAMAKIMLRALRNMAAEQSQVDSEFASELETYQRELASIISASLTKAGQAIQATQVVDTSVEDVMLAAARIAKSLGRNITNKESARIIEAGEDLERRTAELEAAGALVSEQRQETVDAAELAKRASEGELAQKEIEALRKKLAKLRGKEKRREDRIAELDSILPPRRPRTSNVRQRAIDRLMREQDMLMVEIRADLGMDAPLMMAQMRKEQPASPGTPDISGDTINKIARVGALKLLMADGGTLSVAELKKQLASDFGRQVEPFIDRIHAKAVKVRNRILREERERSAISNIAARPGNENLDIDELRDIFEREEQEARRKAKVTAEHTQAAKKYERDTDSLIDGVKVKSPALASAIARHANTDIAAISAAKQSLRGASPDSVIKELRAEYDLSQAEANQAYVSGGLALQNARREIKLSQEMARTLKEYAATSSKELDQALASLQQARRDQTDAQRKVANRLEELQKGRVTTVIGKVFKQTKGVPIALMAGGDMSMFLRQGGIAVMVHPSLMPDFIKASLSNITKAGHAHVIDTITQDPNFTLAQRSGIDFAFAGKSNGGDEFFEGAEILRRIRILKQYVETSDQVFGGSLDQLRMSYFNLLADDLRSSGVTYREQPEAYKTIGRFINIATGRADVGDHNSAVSKAYLALGRLYGFAPRYRLSRIQYLTLPLNRGFWRTPPSARRIIYKDWARWFAVQVATQGLLKGLGFITAGALAGYLNPDDDDFLKIKVGKLRFDITGGIQVPARLLFRLVKEGYRLSTGQVTTKMAAEEAWKQSLRFLHSGADPRFSLAYEYAMGETYDRKPFSWFGDYWFDGAIGSRLAPLGVSNTIKLIKKEGAAYGASAGALEFFGASSNAYPDNPDEPKTDAEYLARRFRTYHESKKPPLDEETKTKLQGLKTRARSGEDVSDEILPLVESGKISDGHGDAIINAKEQTAFQENIRRIESLDDVKRVLRVATPEEKASVAEIIRERQLRAAEKADKDEGERLRPREAEQNRIREQRRKDTRMRNLERKYGDKIGPDIMLGTKTEESQRTIERRRRLRVDPRMVTKASIDADPGIQANQRLYGSPRLPSGIRLPLNNMDLMPLPDLTKKDRARRLGRLNPDIEDDELYKEN